MRRRQSSVLVTTRSWLGKEDRDLEPALQGELTGILNWALAGLERLVVTNDSRFTRVEAGIDALAVMRDLSSPVAAFVRERCTVKPDREVLIDELYAAYKRWAEDNGHSKIAKTTFGRDLRAAAPSVKSRRPRKDETDQRPRFYIGNGFRESGDE